MIDDLQQKDSMVPLSDQEISKPYGMHNEKTPKKWSIAKLLGGGVGALFLICVIIFIVQNANPKTVVEKPNESTEEETTVPMDSNIGVTLEKSTSKDNTVVVAVKGLGSKYVSIGYELQYDAGGVGKGVTSGSKPLDVSGMDTFERDIYLGTCSKNVCKPDVGVTKVSVVLEFTDTAGKKSQFSKEFDL